MEAEVKAQVVQAAAPVVVRVELETLVDTARQKETTAEVGVCLVVEEQARPVSLKGIQQAEATKDQTVEVKAEMDHLHQFLDRQQRMPEAAVGTEILKVVMAVQAVAEMEHL